jgi:hypothetical protein
MRQSMLPALVTLLFLVPSVGKAQGKQQKQAERKIVVLMGAFNEAIRGYDRELKYFERVPESRALLELRNSLVKHSTRISQLDVAGTGSGPAILETAREMERASRQLSAQTGQLRKRADVIGTLDARNVADRMKGHADTMGRTADQVVTMFR